MTEGKRTIMVAPESRTLLAGVVSVAFLLTALFLTPLMLRPADGQAYYLALVLTTLTALPVIARLASNTFDVFEPIIPLSVLIGLAFGVRTMYLAYAPVTLLPIRMGLLRADDFVNSALLLTIAAYCSLLAGYYVIGGAMRIPPLWTRLSKHRMWAPSTLSGVTIAVLLGISVGATIVGRPSPFDPVTNATTTLDLLSSLCQLVGCILALHIAAGDTRRWLPTTLWFVALPLAAWQALLFGTKAPILLMVFAIMAAHHYGRRRISLGLLVAGGVIAVIVVFPIVNTFRQPLRMVQVASASSNLPDIVVRVIALPARLGEMTPTQYVQYAAEGVLSRSTGVDALSLLLKYDVSRELGNPAAYLYIPAYAFIPRVVWPTKPILNQGTRFGRLLVNPTSEGANLIASFGIFHIGDLLVSFGVAGVLIGMCVLGCLYRLTYRFFDPLHSPDLGAKFLYIFVLWSIVSGFQGDIPSHFANILRSLLVWVPLKIWLNARSVGKAMRQLPVMHAGMARSTLVR